MAVFSIGIVIDVFVLALEFPLPLLPKCNLVPRAFPFLSLGRREEKALAPGGHMTFNTQSNLVPRACDPWEGNEGSGIIRFREESDWPLKWNA
jgi:hypothetical protein